MKNEPVYVFDVKVPENESESTYRVQIKKPTRSVLNEAELFHAVKFSDFVKMGLLTAQQMAKRQVDLGGIFTEEQQKTYGKLQSILLEKNEQLMRLLSKENLSEDETERKRDLAQDISIIQVQLGDFEAAKNAAYDQTADARARHEVLLWLLLALTQVGKVTAENENVSFSPMFKGEDHKTRASSLDELEDNQDKVLAASFTKLYSAIMLWYWMGVTDKKKIDESLKVANAADTKS